MQFELSFAKTWSREQGAWSWEGYWGLPPLSVFLTDRSAASELVLPRSFSLPRHGEANFLATALRSGRAVACARLLEPGRTTAFSFILASRSADFVARAERGLVEISRMRRRIQLLSFGRGVEKLSAVGFALPPLSVFLTHRSAASGVGLPRSFSLPRHGEANFLATALRSGHAVASARLLDRGIRIAERGGEFVAWPRVGD